MPSFIYWDSCVLLSWVDGINYPRRLEVLDTVVDELSKTRGHILTSAISKVEVAYFSEEKTHGTLNKELEQRLDDLWVDAEHIKVVEFHDAISARARGLLRQALSRKQTLKPMDAIHIASALWVGENSSVYEFQTYDKGLCRFGQTLGINICEPHPLQLPMGF